MIEKIAKRFVPFIKLNLAGMGLACFYALPGFVDIDSNTGHAHTLGAMFENENRLVCCGNMRVQQVF
jgi:hypothetical protein